MGLSQLKVVKHPMKKDLLVYYKYTNNRTKFPFRLIRSLSIKYEKKIENWLRIYFPRSDKKYHFPGLVNSNKLWPPDELTVIFKLDVSIKIDSPITAIEIFIREEKASQLQCPKYKAFVSRPDACAE